MTALLRPLLLCLLLAACGRPLSEAEQSFMGELQPGLDTSRIRLVEHPLIGLRTRTRATRPRTTCQERILPPPQSETVQVTTAGAVMFNHVWINPDFYLEDYLDAYPDRLNLAAAMFLAHEMTHIWQWQNREITGYHPLRGASEHWVSDDPYLFDPTEDRAFLDYGYEQQASLVEEYICCRAIQPDGARTARLEAMLSEVMDLTPMQRLMSSPDVYLPAPDPDLGGICS